VRESRTPGSVRGVLSHEHPYRNNRPILLKKSISADDAKIAALGRREDHFKLRGYQYQLASHHRAFR